MINDLLFKVFKKISENREIILPESNQKPPILTQRRDIRVAGNVDKGPDKIKIHIKKDSLGRKTNKAFKPISRCQIPISKLKIIIMN